MNTLISRLAALQSVTSQEGVALPEIPQDGRDFDSLKLLFSNLITEGLQHQQPDWAAHMSPSIDDAQLLGATLAAGHAGNLLSPAYYPLLAAASEQTLGWLCGLFSMPLGHFTSGGSTANLEALWQARTADKENRRIVYTASSAHYSIAKACHILGLTLRYIPVSGEREEIDLAALRQSCEGMPPLAIVATAGTVITGAIDPLQACADLADELDCWLHIDASWGGALALLSKPSTALVGMSCANSISFDPHKTLGVPRPCAVLCYQQKFNTPFSADASYLNQPPDTQLLGSHGAEHCLPLWVMLQTHGTEHIAKRTQSRLDQAKQFATLIAPDVAWYSLSQTGIVCFRVSGDPDLILLINQGLLSSAMLVGKHIYRVVFANNHTQAVAIYEKLIGIIGR